MPDHLSPPDHVPDIALTEDRLDEDSQRDLRELHHGYLAAISYLDAQVGRVLDELDALGLDQQTIVIFWSDHGLHIGEHGLFRKTTLFELDAHVPMIISAPQYRAGQRSDSLVELLDIYPTLLELCDLPGDPALEGKSLVPLLEDPGRTIKPAALTQSPRPNYLRGGTPEVMGYSVRSEEFRYTEWRDFQTGSVRARELYDHRSDPLEMINVAERPDRTDRLASLAELLERLLEE